MDQDSPLACLLVGQPTLEHVGLLGDAVDGRLAGYVTDGMSVGGWRAQVASKELRRVGGFSIIDPGRQLDPRL